MCMARMQTAESCIDNLLVRNADVIEIFEELQGLAQGETKVDVEGQARGHDMGVILAELEEGGIFRQEFKEALIKPLLSQNLRQMHTDLQRNMSLRGTNPVRETL